MGHSHHHHQPSAEAGGAGYHDARYKAARKVTLIGSAVDLLLGVAKIVAGYIGSSQALIADGIHSLSDLATDGVVLFAMKHGSREADEKHPYGHARIETLATITLGVALIGVAIGIAWDAFLRLRHPELLMHPGWLALVVPVFRLFPKRSFTSTPCALQRNGIPACCAPMPGTVARMPFPRSLWSSAYWAA